MKRIITLSLLFIVFFAMSASNRAEEQNKSRLILGVLEHHHVQWPDWGPSSFPEMERKYKFQVRVLFEKHGSSWTAFKHDVHTLADLMDSTKYYQREIGWFVAFDGKTIGQLKSTVPETIPYYAAVGLHLLDPKVNPPTVGKLTKEFAGWPDEPCFRPLILVSRNNSSDPQMWKPVRPSASVMQKCREAFRKEIGPITLCDEKSGHKTLTNYDDSRIHQIKSYRSKDGEYLASFQLDLALNKCEGGHDAFGVQWFFIEKSGFVRHIGKGMTLLDAGDYDNDGVSEVVFWRSGYNEDGYVLFYNHFSDHIEFTWNYH